MIPPSPLSSLLEQTTHFVSFIHYTTNIILINSHQVIHRYHIEYVDDIYQTTRDPDIYTQTQYCTAVYTQLVYHTDRQLSEHVFSRERQQTQRHNTASSSPSLLCRGSLTVFLSSCPPDRCVLCVYEMWSLHYYYTSKGRAGSPRVVTGGVCMLSAPPCKRVRKVSLSSVKYSTQYCQTLSQSSLKKEERNERKAMRGKEGRGGCGWCVVLSFSTPFCVHVCRDTGRRR